VRVLRGIHTARRAASNSEIKTGAIRAGKSGAVRRVAALNMHDVQHNDSPRGAVQRRWSADRSCFAAPCGAQCAWMPFYRDVQLLMKLSLIKTNRKYVFECFLKVTKFDRPMLCIGTAMGELIPGFTD